MKELKLRNSPDNDQLEIILFPRKPKPHYKFDILRLKMRSIEDGERLIDMTPDEALELAAFLTMAANIYLCEQREYKQKFIKPKLALDKKSTPIKGKEKV